MDPAHTSQRCSRCGHVHRDNRPSQAVFACGACRFRTRTPTTMRRSTFWCGQGFRACPFRPAGQGRLHGEGRSRGGPRRPVNEMGRLSSPAYESQTEARGLVQPRDILNHAPGSRPAPYHLQTIAGCARICGYLARKTANRPATIRCSSRRDPHPQIFPSQPGCQRPKKYFSPVESPTGIEVPDSSMPELAAS